MKRITVTAQPRNETKKLHGMIKKGFTPGVIYNQKGDVEHIKIASNAVQSFIQEIEGTPLVDIQVEGGHTHVALIKEIQKDLRRNAINHLSFMALDPEREAVFDIELVPTGESLAVKNNLGVLIISLKSLELRGLPKDIPSEIPVDITKLEKIGDIITVADLQIPEGLEFVRENVKEYAVASIQQFQKTVEEEKAEEAAAAVAEGTAEEGTEEGEAAEAGEESDKTGGDDTPAEQPPKE